MIVVCAKGKPVLCSFVVLLKSDLGEGNCSIHAVACIINL